MLLQKGREQLTLFDVCYVLKFFGEVKTHTGKMLQWVCNTAEFQPPTQPNNFRRECNESDVRTGRDVLANSFDR